MINRAICLLAFYTFVYLVVKFTLCSCCFLLFTKNSIHGRFKKAFLLLAGSRNFRYIFVLLQHFFLNFLVRLVKIFVLFFSKFYKLLLLLRRRRRRARSTTRTERILLVCISENNRVLEKTGKNLRSLSFANLLFSRSSSPTLLSLSLRA